ncbi:hypothetical protein ACQPZK_08980 [Micromonospora sp. CA-249363]|uniref:hypothetical protein n=1 Tax=Micromonospora sp. CA-249363 TaxID=3239963 RepID=UPI003D8F0317
MPGDGVVRLHSEESAVEMVEQLVSRADAAYQRWLASVTGDVVAGPVLIYGRESLRERNTTYGIGEWLAGYLMIGQEGDRGLFLRCDGDGDGDGGPVFGADLGGLGEVDLDVAAPAFEVWRRSGFALPAGPEPELPPTADVYVGNIPLDGVELLVRARKLLGVDWRFGDLRGLLATQPFLAARSAHLYALRRDLQRAPELRPYLLYATGRGLEAIWPTGSRPAE